MANNNRNRGSNAADENRNKQQRNLDDNQFNQSNYNPTNMDLDRDGNTGNTGGFYGGTNYMGTSYMGTNYMANEFGQNQDWNYQDQQKYQEGHNKNNRRNDDYQNRQNHRYNEQNRFGNMSDQPYSGHQNYNRNDDYNRQGFNQQHSNQNNYNQWQENRQNNVYRDNRQHGEHGFYYGHAAGLGHQEDQPNRQQYNSDSNNRGNNWGQQNRGDRNDYWNKGNSNNGRSWWDKTKDQVSSWFGDNDTERRHRRDHHTEGQYRGKGPKEYRRSDNRIHEDVCDRLSDDPYVDASDVEVKVENGEVTVSGTVDNRNTRRRIEDIIDSVQGVSHVQNNLRVGQAMTVGSTTIKTSAVENGPVSNTNIDSGRTK